MAKAVLKYPRTYTIGSKTFVQGVETPISEDLADVLDGKPNFIIVRGGELRRVTIIKKGAAKKAEAGETVKKRSGPRSKKRAEKVEKTLRSREGAEAEGGQKAKAKEAGTEGAVQV